MESLAVLDKIEVANKMNKHTFDVDKVKQGVRLILEGVGENPEREGLKDTPRRVAQMYKELIKHPADYEGGIDFNMTTFSSENYKQMIVVQDIPFISHCEHHMAPFHGKIHVGYISEERIVGLSKIPRVVEFFARRLQVQERMTQQIADYLYERLQPKGVIVVAQAEHTCISTRGVKKVGTITTTSALKGVFLEKDHPKQEFFNLIRNALR